METKQCRQCGEIKPLEQFRKYYGGRRGTYTMCKDCERINSRAKYLSHKGQGITVAEQAELDKIYTLYDAQRACGLQPPRRESGRSTTLVDNLDSMIAAYTAKANLVPPNKLVLEADSAPTELRQWLSCELTKEPDHYLDEIYEQLKDKYMPVLRIDSDTLLPVRDETYRDTLEMILGRFNRYEDDYYNKEANN